MCDASKDARFHWLHFGKNDLRPVTNGCRDIVRGMDAGASVFDFFGKNDFSNLSGSLKNGAFSPIFYQHVAL